MSAVLELRGVVAGYGELQVLRGIDLSVTEGSISLLIGPNGAGKSTVLKTVFGMLPVSAGTVTYRGETITDLRPAGSLRRGIGYIPQGRCNFPMLTVRENLEMAAYTRSDKAVSGDVTAAIEASAALRDKAGMRAGYMSGGEQQLLEMAMAMILRPTLLLIDEPSIGLAPAMVRDVLATLDRIRQDGCTVLLVEQNVQAALEVADAVAVLDLGRVRMVGAPEEVMRSPELRDVYLGGSMKTREKGS